MSYKLDVMFPEDEVDCVLIATGALDEECCDVDSDVEAIEEDDDDDDVYDETIPGMTSTISMEGVEADADRQRQPQHRKLQPRQSV